MNGGLTLLTDALKRLASSFGAAEGYGVLLWFLGLVFAWSGIVKLRRPTLTALAIADFDATRRIYPILGWLLGAFELALALALASHLMSRLVLMVAAVVLWTFATLIARSLLAGKAFACFCFGDSDGSLSRWTLIRTLALALIATGGAIITPPDMAQLTLANRGLQSAVALSSLGIIVLAGMTSQVLSWRRIVGPTLSLAEITA